MARLRKVTLSAFTDTYVPFAALLVAALLAAEVAQNLARFRALYCFWVAIALAIPAVCFFFAGRGSQLGRTYWLLFWTWAWVAFLCHLGFTCWGVGEGLGFVRWLLFLWWTLDVVVGWLGSPDAGWTRTPRTLLHLVLIVYVAAKTFSSGGLEQILGIVLVAAFLISLLANRRLRSATSAA